MLSRLPTGTTCKQLPLWDEVQFPIPTNPPSSVLDVPRVQIASLDSIGQRAFAGMQELNLIQSVVYPIAYHTAENLLVSASTGAGKTNVAMLAIVQLLRSHLTKDSVFDLKSFKIVYLALMKPLAAELATAFAKRPASLGLQMLVSTPEKWDVISRKGSGDATLVTLVKLLIIDEIHLLHEDRCAVIEVLVARTLRQVETSQTLIRLVGLSATLPNYEDVAHLLHVSPYHGLFYFDDRFRPVLLRMSFYGVRGSNRRVQEANMSAACYELLLEQVKRVEQRLFADEHIRTLVCTATLAWGVNLPAHAVIIKGTRVYKAEKSDFVELDILDVLQIFGRVGRPQFDTKSVASVITSIDKLDHYLRLITNQHPIENSLMSNLNDRLDAESDSALSDYLSRVVRSSTLDLDASEMIRYEPQTGRLASTDRGRTASLFYIRFFAAAMVRDTLEPTTMLPQLFSVLSEASEFVAMKVRDEASGELNNLKGSFCHVPIQKAGNVDSDVPAKVNALLQGYISRHSPVCHPLASDMNYIHQKAGRLARYLFEISLRQGWSSCASTTLLLARVIEQRQWDGQTPLWQFAGASSHRLLQRVDEMELSVDRIRESEIYESSHFVFKSKEPRSLVCTIPLFKPFPARYLVRVNSDRWLGADTVCPFSFKRLLLPPSDLPSTGEHVSKFFRQFTSIMPQACSARRRKEVFQYLVSVSSMPRHTRFPFILFDSVFFAPGIPQPNTARHLS
ncbi:hypothetical protein P879_08608 [Paragonimus westermani]|uniref:Helicase ATP-binding domain-containing protein n=1 Tax=Paragonimus westermani TaxID=34504 RepID=A0A8T0D650_9TREM|nr:hypothetical protein P879_08608 [Paragonimus westermani]